MLRRCAFTLLLVAYFSVSGCIVASAKGNRFGSDRAVVAVDGHVYLVDTRDVAVYELDLQKAKRFDPQESTEEPAPE